MAASVVGNPHNNYIQPHAEVSHIRFHRRRSQRIKRNGRFYLSGLKHDSYDIVVGIPSFNNRSTIKHVVEVSSRGLKEYFPELKSCIVNSDGGSGDGTEGSFYSANSMGLDLLSFKYTGISGKGSAMRSILELASRLGIKPCFSRFRPQECRAFLIENWPGQLLIWMLHTWPYYIRHKYDGTITNSICYPLTTSLYGRKVRQPIGGDFGVGRDDRLLCVDGRSRNCDISRFGIDIWMTTRDKRSQERYTRLLWGADPR